VERFPLARRRRVRFSAIRFYSGAVNSYARVSAMRGCTGDLDVFAHFDNVNSLIILDTLLDASHAQRVRFSAIVLTLGAAMFVGKFVKIIFIGGWPNECLGEVKYMHIYLIKYIL
jgi:hypothetical protein